MEPEPFEKMNDITTYSVITDKDDFHPSNFPEIGKELAEIKRLVIPLRYVDNEVIILSYLKNRHLRADLALSHPKIIEILANKDNCRHLEDLFVSCKENDRFRLSLENYVVYQLNK